MQFCHHFLRCFLFSKKNDNKRGKMDSDIKSYSEWSVSDQLNLLEKLLRNSQPEVKYRFQQRVVEFTRYDIIKDLPLEVAELILIYCDLNSLLHCRCVSRQWLHKVNNCPRVWTPFLKQYSININNFGAHHVFDGPLTRIKSYSSLKNNSASDISKGNGAECTSKSENINLQVIGENLFSKFADMSVQDMDDSTVRFSYFLFLFLQSLTKFYFTRYLYLLQLLVSNYQGGHSSLNSLNSLNCS